VKHQSCEGHPCSAAWHGAQRALWQARVAVGERSIEEAEAGSVYATQDPQAASAPPVRPRPDRRRTPLRAQ